MRIACHTPFCGKYAWSTDGGLCVKCFAELEPDEQKALLMARRSPFYADDLLLQLIELTEAGRASGQLIERRRRRKEARRRLKRIREEQARRLAA